MVTGVSSFGCVWLFPNNFMALKIISSNCSITLFRFINYQFQNISYGYASTGITKWSSFKLVFRSTPKEAYNALRQQSIGIGFLVSRGTFIVANNWCSLFSVVCSGTIRVLYHVNVFIYLPSWLSWSNICISGVATENIYSLFLNGVHLSFWSCLIFTLYHNFWVCQNFLHLIGK